MFKILIIDDSVLMRNHSRSALEAEGFTVDDLLPASVEELRERLEANPPDLVLSDYNMPILDGLAVARAIRHINPKIPVVILSSNRDAARDAHLKAVGVRLILHKPISPTDLFDAVVKVLAAS